MGTSATPDREGDLARGRRWRRRQAHRRSTRTLPETRAGGRFEGLPVAHRRRRYRKAQWLRHEWALLHRGSLGSGMARVYLGRMVGSAGFTRLVAIKRLHAELAAEEQFVAMLLDEGAPHSAHPYPERRRHPRSRSGRLRLPASSWSTWRRRTRVPDEGGAQAEAVRSHRARPWSGVLRGLEAAHEARDEGRSAARHRAPRRVAAERAGRHRRRPADHRLRHRQVARRLHLDPPGRIAASSRTWRPSRCRSTR